VPAPGADGVVLLAPMSGEIVGPGYGGAA
jgi:hypothetical protein